MLLVEQNATMALGVADLAYVLDVGEVSLSGDARGLAATDEVQRLYLGQTATSPGRRPRRQDAVAVDVVTAARAEEAADRTSRAVEVDNVSVRFGASRP